MSDYVLCSKCFKDEGLRLDAAQIGNSEISRCPNCGATEGQKLDKHLLASLAHRFFVWGTLNRMDYGAAPIVQFNEHQRTCIDVPPWLETDIRLIERVLGVGFFYYGPRLWMVGEVEPLKSLLDPKSRNDIIDRIIDEYPEYEWLQDEVFYRVRKSPNRPSEIGEYDSPPIAMAGSGRLDSVGFPVMYGSPDLQVCVHECRVTAEDDLFVATLKSNKNLRLLNLADILEEDVTEFESLDIAVHFLFLAGSHAHGVTRQIALGVRDAGYDGIMYPSYFSLLRTGGMPFETVYGISHRRIRQLHDRERAKTVPNLAIFGRPLESGEVEVKCINRVIMHRVEYGIHFGPVGY